MPDDTLDAFPSFTSTFRHCISLRLENLSLLDLKDDLVRKMSAPTLPGAWECKLSRPDEDVVVVRVGFRHIPVGSLGRNVKQTIRFAYLDASAQPQVLHEIKLDPDELCPDGFYSGFSLILRHSRLRELETAAFKLSTHTDYSVELILEGEAPLGGSPTASSLAAARRMGASLTQPNYHDVCLTFPREGAHSLRLFTNRTFLTQASPYFADLFSSGFAEASSNAIINVPPETSSRPAKRARRARSSSPVASDDSDAETDEIYVTEAMETAEEGLRASTHEVVISEASYSTYRAVLTYLRTGFIDFTFLSTAYAPVLSSTKRKRRDHVLDKASTVDRAVFPVSPKSVFSLAHFLQLPVLEALALAHLRHSLRVETVALELVSRVTLLYSDVQDVVVAFIVEHFEEVEKSEKYEEVMGRIRAGEIPEAAPVVAALLSAQRDALKAAKK